MLRPAGPRISSMMPLTRSGVRYCCNSRSVASKLPIREPDADIRETNSSSRSSTTSASTLPSVDIASDNSRTSSSSSWDQTLPPYVSPSASIRIAARFGPLMGAVFSRPLWRCARVAITLVISVEFWACVMFRSRCCGVTEPLTNNGGGFVGIAFGQFAHAMHRLGVDLALNLGDVDQLRGLGGGRQRRSRRRLVGPRRQRPSVQRIDLVGG